MTEDTLCVDCEDVDETKPCDQCGRPVCPDCNCFAEGWRCLECDDDVCRYNPATGRDGDR